jgi:hypothetical protein
MYENPDKRWKMTAKALIDHIVDHFKASGRNAQAGRCAAYSGQLR